MTNLNQNRLACTLCFGCMVVACSGEPDVVELVPADQPVIDTDALVIGENEPAIDPDEPVYIDYIGEPGFDSPASAREFDAVRKALSTTGWQRDNQWTYFAWGDAIGNVDCPTEANWKDHAINAWAAYWYGINEETFTGGKIQVIDNNVLFPARPHTRCSGSRHDVLLRYGDPTTLGSPCNTSNTVACTKPHATQGDINCTIAPWFGDCTVGLFEVVLDKDKIVASANARGLNPDVYELYVWCHEFGHALGLDHNSDTSGPDHTCMVTAASATHINNWYASGHTVYYKNYEYEFVATNYNRGGGERNCSGKCNPT